MPDSCRLQFDRKCAVHRLENESQGAFDHLSTEVATLKTAISTLSNVVDGELALMREELKAIREEMRGTVHDARTEADTAAQKVADASRSSQALVELSVGQLKENVGRLENELREAHNKHAELAASHSGAVARLDATAEAAKTETLRGIDALSERVSRSERRDDFGLDDDIASPGAARSRACGQHASSRRRASRRGPCSRQEAVLGRI